MMPLEPPPKPCEAITEQAPQPGPSSPAPTEPRCYRVFGLDAVSNEPREPLMLQGNSKEEVCEQAAAAGMTAQEVYLVGPDAQDDPAPFQTGEDFLTFAKYLVDLYPDQEPTLESAVAHLEQHGAVHVARELGDLATIPAVYEELMKLTRLLPPDTSLEAILDVDGMIEVAAEDASSLSNSAYSFSEEHKAEFRLAGHWMRIMGMILVAMGALMCLGIFLLRIDFVIQGILTLVIGVYTLSTANAFGNVGQLTGLDIPYLMHAITNLKGLYRLQVMMILICLAILVLALMVIASTATSRGF